MAVIGYTTRLADRAARQSSPKTQSSLRTQDLPRSELIELWETHNAETLFALRCRTFDIPHLDATGVNIDVEDIGPARIT